MNTVAPLEVGFVVADIDRLLPFYRDVLGLAVIGDIESPAVRSRESGLAPDGYRVLRLESRSGDRLKLAQPAGVSRPAASRAGYAMHCAGACYLTFIVADLADVYERLRQADADIRSRGIVQLRAGLHMLLVVDPEGNFIEILQYDDLSAYRPVSNPVARSTP